MNTKDNTGDIYNNGLGVSLKGFYRINKKTILVAVISILFFVMAHLIWRTKLFSIMQIATFVGVVAAGQTLVFLIGGIDLSVSSILTLAAIFASELLAQGVHLIPTILIVLLTGAAIGAISGAGISLIKIPPLVMTLAMQSIIQGVIMVTTNGTPRSGRSEWLETFINHKFFLGFTGAIVVWIFVGVFLTWMFHKTRFGRHIYILGTSEKVAKLSGVRTRVVTTSVYMMSGLLSALAGIMLLGYTGSTSVQLGKYYLLPSIAAVLLGGISPLGGKGNYVGTMFGAFLLMTLEGVLTVLKISSALRTMIEGVIILLFVIIYNTQFSSARREKTVKN